MKYVGFSSILGKDFVELAMPLAYWNGVIGIQILDVREIEL